VSPSLGKGGGEKKGELAPLFAGYSSLGIREHQKKLEVTVPLLNFLLRLGSHPS